MMQSVPELFLLTSKFFGSVKNFSPLLPTFFQDGLTGELATPITINCYFQCQDGKQVPKGQRTQIPILGISDSDWEVPILDLIEALSFEKNMVVRGDFS